MKPVTALTTGIDQSYASLLEVNERLRQALDGARALLVTEREHVARLTTATADAQREVERLKRHQQQIQIGSVLEPDHRMMFERELVAAIAAVCARWVRCTCGRFFYKVGKQRYCTHACMQKVAMQRFRRKPRTPKGAE